MYWQGTRRAGSCFRKGREGCNDPRGQEQLWYSREVEAPSGTQGCSRTLEPSTTPRWRGPNHETRWGRPGLQPPPHQHPVTSPASCWLRVRFPPESTHPSNSSPSPHPRCRPAPCTALLLSQRPKFSDGDHRGLSAHVSRRMSPGSPL